MHNPAHPGEILQELVVNPLDLTITDVSEHLNVSRKTLSKVLNGRGAITPKTYRMTNQVNQYHDLLHIGRYPGHIGNNLGQSGMSLLVADFWVGGKPNPPSPDFLSAKRGMVAKVRKKRTRL